MALSSAPDESSAQPETARRSTGSTSNSTSANGNVPVIASTLETLGEVARDPRVDDRAQARMAALQETLTVDLAWLAGTLADACEKGPSPAREAASHLVAAGGKRVRPMATLLSAAAANGLSGDKVARAPLRQAQANSAAVLPCTTRS